MSDWSHAPAGGTGPRVAIIGSGISGLFAAHRLYPHCDLTIFEADAHVGGHSNTLEVAMDGQRLAIDTGFIVFNARNYPNFKRLLEALDVPYQPSDMSFSFRCDGNGLEYRGDNTFDAIFAQRRNVLRPSFYRMIVDILRFNRSAAGLLGADANETLGDYLARHRFGGPMVDDYLLPMAAAIWSAEPAAILDFPAQAFGRFCHNHGLLQVDGRPQWLTVSGGSREYVRALARPFRDRIRLATPVESVERLPDHVLIKPHGKPAQSFDYAILACHSDEALAVLRDASTVERDILGSIPYRANETILHTDVRQLPQRRRAWASWNYRRGGPAAPSSASVTYNLTRLQSLPTHRQFLVTLNPCDPIDPRSIIYRTSYSHPVYNTSSIRAQARHAEINGANRTFFCGAYWGYGFHEDGVRSALAVCDAFQAITGLPTADEPDMAATRQTGPTDEVDAKLYLSGTG